MRKIIKVFPILVLMVIMGLMALITDINEYSSFVHFENQSTNYKLQMVSLPNNISKQQFMEIIKMSDEDLVITKEDFNVKLNCVDTFSTNTNLYSYLNDGQKSELSTFESDNYKVINDFLNDSRYRFLRMNRYLKKSDAIYGGNISVYYKDLTKLNRFKNDVAKLVGCSVNKLDSSTKIWDYPVDKVIGLLSFLIIFFIGFYVLLISYCVINNSYEISVYRLLGFKDKDIIKQLFSSKSLYIVALISIFIACLLKNQEFIKYWIISVICFILTTKFLQILCLRILSGKSLVNLIKKEKHDRLLFNLLLANKLIIKIIMVFLLSTIGVQLITMTTNVNNIKDSKVIDYAMVTNVADGVEIKDQDLLGFYRDLDKHNIDYLYADFYIFSDESMKNTDQNYLKALWKENFLYARVDQHYVDKYQIKIKKAPKVLNNCYLYPDSKLKYLDNFKKWNQERNNLPIYIYHEKSLPTLFVDEAPSEVNNVVLKVIDKNTKVSYFNSPHGLDIAGTGFGTDLKIRLQHNIDETYNQLLPILEKHHLTKLINRECLRSVKAYKQGLITNIKQGVINCGLIFIFLFILDVLVTCLCMVISYRVNQEKVIVEKLLGFKKCHIIAKILMKNWIVDLIVLFGGIIYLLFNFNVQIMWIIISLFIISSLVTWICCWLIERRVAYDKN